MFLMYCLWFRVGRPDNRSVSLRIEWEEEELVNLINESYPVLADKQFMSMIGAAWNRNLPLPQLTTHRIKDARASRLALLWVLPAKGVTVRCLVSRYIVSNPDNKNKKGSPVLSACRSICLSVLPI